MLLFQIQGENEQEVSPGDLIVITPGTVNRYGGAFHQNFVEETLLFSGEIADHFAEAGVLKSGKISSFPPGFSLRYCFFSNLSSIQQTQANFKLLELLSLIYERLCSPRWSVLCTIASLTPPLLSRFA